MYPLVQMPLHLNKDVFSLTKQDAKAYFKWFLEIRNKRLQILEINIKQMYPEWKLDYSKNSFHKLYEWFSQQVAYRPMTEIEKQEIRKQIGRTPLLVDVVPIPELTFTDATVSICFDVGVYFGESLIFNVQNAKWVQKITSINFIDYAQPLIAKENNKVPLNPRRIAESLAKRILDNHEVETTFVQLLDKWFNKWSGEHN